jgi:hypothetical protein
MDAKSAPAGAAAVIALLAYLLCPAAGQRIGIVSSA